MTAQAYKSTAVNPKLTHLRQRIDHTIKLSAEKAAAHLKNPAQYPLPAGKDNLEFAIVDFFKALPKRKRDKFLDKMKEALNTGTAVRQQQYGALAAVDLHKATTVADQVMLLPVPGSLKMTEDDIAKLKTPAKKIKAEEGPSGKKRQARQVVAGTTLKFAVENITCNETNDVRKDEVTFSAFAISSTGEQQDSNNFFSAKFKEGESRSPGAAGDLFSFDLGDSTGVVFPASFSGGVFILEKGLIGSDDVADKLSAILRITGKVISLASIGVGFIPGAGLPLAFAVLGVGALLIFIGDLFFFGGGDIFSQVISDELLLEKPPAAGQTFARNLTIGFEDDGFIVKDKYSVAVRWSVA